MAFDFPQSHLIFRVPRSHWHAQVANFKWSDVRPNATRPAIEAWWQRAINGEAPHLLMTGLPGCGKSHLGVGLYRAMASLFGTERVTYIHVPTFCETVKRGYGDDSTNFAWSDIELATRLVVLDDLFGRELTAHDKDQIFTRILETAYSNHAALVATMNPSVEELQTRLPPHEISRLLADAVVIPMVGVKDQRRSQRVVAQ